MTLFACERSLGWMLRSSSTTSEPASVSTRVGNVQTGQSKRKTRLSAPRWRWHPWFQAPVFTTRAAWKYPRAGDSRPVRLVSKSRRMIHDSSGLFWNGGARFTTGAACFAFRERDSRPVRLVSIFRRTIHDRRSLFQNSRRRFTTGAACIFRLEAGVTKERRLPEEGRHPSSFVPLAGNPPV